MLVFEKFSDSFPEWMYQFEDSPRVYKFSDFLNFSLLHADICVVDSSHYDEGEMGLNDVFICISLIALAT